MVPKTETPHNKLGKARPPKSNQQPQLCSHDSVELCGCCQPSAPSTWLPLLGPCPQLPHISQC